MKTITLFFCIFLSQTGLAINAGMKHSVFPDSLETRFWEFFQSQLNEAGEYTQSVDKQIIISEKLNAYFPGLGLGFLITFKDGKKQLQIYLTAYGDKTKFATIDKLVKKLPKSDKYSIVAFAPPSYLKDSLSFNGKTIRTMDITFAYQKNNNAIDISLFLPEKVTESEEEFAYA